MPQLPRRVPACGASFRIGGGRAHAPPRPAPPRRGEPCPAPALPPSRGAPPVRRAGERAAGGRGAGWSGAAFRDPRRGVAWCGVAGREGARRRAGLVGAGPGALPCGGGRGWRRPAGGSGAGRAAGAACAGRGRAAKLRGVVRGSPVRCESGRCRCRYRCRGPPERGLRAAVARSARPPAPLPAPRGTGPTGQRREDGAARCGESRVLRDGARRPHLYSWLFSPRRLTADGKAAFPHVSRRAGTAAVSSVSPFCCLAARARCQSAAAAFECPRIRNGAPRGVGSAWERLPRCAHPSASTSWSSGALLCRCLSCSIAVPFCRRLLCAINLYVCHSKGFNRPN